MMLTCNRCGGPVIEGEPCMLCVAGDELAAREGIDPATRAQMDAQFRRSFAAFEEEYASMTPEELAQREREMEERMWELPPTVRPLGSELEFRCSFFSDGEVFDSLQLRIGDTGIFCERPGCGIQLFARPWSHITELRVEGPEVAERRVTAPRVAALGLLALAAKKRTARSFLVVQTMGREDHYFEVPVDPFELRAHLALRKSWLEQNGPALRTA